MGLPESPVLTDAEEIKQGIDRALERMDAIEQRLDLYRDGINSIGANLQWLVDNTQGLFQMFASPAFIQQMAQAVGVFGGGQPESGSEPGTGPAVGS